MYKMIKNITIKKCVRVIKRYKYTKNKQIMFEVLLRNINELWLKHTGHEFFVKGKTKEKMYRNCFTKLLLFTINEYYLIIRLFASEKTDFVWLNSQFGSDSNLKSFTRFEFTIVILCNFCYFEIVYILIFGMYILILA